MFIISAKFNATQVVLQVSAKHQSVELVIYKWHLNGNWFCEVKCAKKKMVSNEFFCVKIVQLKLNLPYMTLKYLIVYFEHFSDPENRTKKSIN